MRTYTSNKYNMRIGATPQKEKESSEIREYKEKFKKKIFKLTKINRRITILLYQTNVGK